MVRLNLGAGGQSKRIFLAQGRPLGRLYPLKNHPFGIVIGVGELDRG